MFTPEYLTAKKNVEILQLQFAKNPCKKTATPLSNSRVILSKTQMYTDAFRKDRDQNFANELMNLIIDFNTYK